MKILIIKYRDKIMHAIVSCAVYLIAFYICANFYLSAGFAVSIGFGKELYDESQGRKWDNWDLLADFIGIIIGFLLFSI